MNYRYSYKIIFVPSVELRKNIFNIFKVKYELTVLEQFLTNLGKMGVADKVGFMKKKRSLSNLCGHSDKYVIKTYILYRSMFF